MYFIVYGLSKEDPLQVLNNAFSTQAAHLGVEKKPESSPAGRAQTFAVTFFARLSASDSSQDERPRSQKCSRERLGFLGFLNNQPDISDFGKGSWDLCFI